MFKPYYSPEQSAILISLVVFNFSHYSSDSGAVCPSAEVQRQSRTFPMVSDATYKRVLDILFPTDDAERAKTFLAMTLRFAPSSRPESQIIIRRRRETTQVVEYTSASGNIYQKLNEALSRGERDDPNEMVKQLRARRRTVTVPIVRIKQWHVAFLDAVSKSTSLFLQRAESFDKSGEESVAVHGAFYELSYTQGMNLMSFKFYDQDLGESLPTGESRLAQWMNSVRLEVENLKN